MVAMDLLDDAPSFKVLVVMTLVAKLVLVIRLVATLVTVSKECGREVVLYSTLVVVSTGVYTPVTVLDATIIRGFEDVLSLLSCAAASKTKAAAKVMCFVNMVSLRMCLRMSTVGGCLW